MEYYTENEEAEWKVELGDRRRTDRRCLREGLHVGVPGLLLDGEEDSGLAVGAQQRRGEHREPARRAPQEQLRGAHPPLQRRRHAPRLAVVAHRHVAGADAVAGRRSALAHG